MDTKNLTELAKLVSFCRKNGITHIKTGEIELDIAISALFPESKYKKKKQLESNTSDPVSEKQYTEEEILMWSSLAPGMEGTN